MKRCSRRVIALAVLGGVGVRRLVVVAVRDAGGDQAVDVHREEREVRAPRDRGGQPARGQGDEDLDAALGRRVRSDEDRVARARRRVRQEGRGRREVRSERAREAAARWPSRISPRRMRSSRARRSSRRPRSRAATPMPTTAADELEQQKRFAQKDPEIFSRNQIIESEIDQNLAGAKQDHATEAKQIERQRSTSNAAVIGVERQKAQLAIDHANQALKSMEVTAPNDGVLVLQRNWNGALAEARRSAVPGPESRRDSGARCDGGRGLRARGRWLGARRETAGRRHGRGAPGSGVDTARSASSTSSRSRATRARRSTTSA